MSNIFSKREKLAVLSLIILFSLTAILGEMGIFRFFPWADILLHFLGGFFVAMFFVDFLHRALKVERSLLSDLIIILGASLLVGVVWEIFEYCLNFILPSAVDLFRGGDLFDTLKDLIVDTAGALTLFFVVKNKRGK